MKTLIFNILLLCYTISTVAQTQRDTLSLKIGFIDKCQSGHYTHAVITLKNETPDFIFTFVGKYSVEVGSEYYATISVEAESFDGKLYKNIVPCFNFGGKRVRRLAPKQEINQLLVFINVTENFSFSTSCEWNNLKRMRVRLISKYGGTRDREKGVDFYAPKEICSEWVDMTGPKFDFLREKD